MLIHSWRIYLFEWYLHNQKQFCTHVYKYFGYFTLFGKHTYFLTSRLHIGACIVLYRERVNNHQTNKTS